MAITDITQWPQLWPNNSGSPAALVKGLAAIDIVKQTNYLPPSAGPLEFANWLREPVIDLVANITVIVADAVEAAAAPILETARGSAAQAYYYSRSTAVAAQQAADAVVAAQAAAAQAQAVISARNFLIVASLTL